MHLLSNPVLDLLMIFLAGYFLEGNGESHGTGFSLNLAAQGFSEREKPCRWQRGDITLGKFSLDLSKVLANGIDADITSDEPFFAKRFEIDSALVLDVILKLPAPLDEGRFRNFQVLGDPGKTPALSAKENKSLLSFSIIHNSRERDEGNPAAPPSADALGDRPLLSRRHHTSVF